MSNRGSAFDRIKSNFILGGGVEGRTHVSAHRQQKKKRNKKKKRETAQSPDQKLLEGNYGGIDYCG